MVIEKIKSFFGYEESPGPDPEAIIFEESPGPDPEAIAVEENPGPDPISVNDLPDAKAQSFNTLSGPEATTFDGDKFFGGFGNTKVFFNDYWTLRQRSKQLFSENLYARGLLRRMITNEINVGLTLESTPINDILNEDEDKINEWAENVENRFSIWATNKNLCDYKKRETFGELQQRARLAALISGDVLVVIRRDRITQLPMVQLIEGDDIRTPLDAKPQKGNKISHGVEIDKRGRHVAFWVNQGEGVSKRISTFGERSKRRIAWLVYGTELLIGKVRGDPLLSIILQSLKEVDRYRDSTQRKAVINSVIAMFVKKGEAKAGTRPMTGGATRRDTVTDTTSSSGSRTFKIASQIPGVILDELQQGEEPVGFNTAGADINFPIFEGAVINAIAWANEYPPEVVQLLFSRNYSASRGAVSELKMFLNKIRSAFGMSFCQPFFEDFLITETLIGKIEANGLISAWRDPLQYDLFGAWISTEWSGAIKPSIDLKKEVDAYEKMVSEGFITHERATKELNGLKYSKVIKRLKGENQLKAEAMRPLLELAKEFNLSLDDVGLNQKRPELELVVNNEP